MQTFRFISNDGGSIDIEAENESEARIELLGRLGWGLSDEDDTPDCQCVEPGCPKCDLDGGA